MTEKKLTEEELAQASGGAQINISSEKAANREGLEGGSGEAAAGGSDDLQKPFVADNGLTAAPGG